MVVVDLPTNLRELALRAALQETDLPRLQEQALRTGNLIRSRLLNKQCLFHIICLLFNHFLKNSMLLTLV